MLLGPALADESILPLDRLVGRRVGDFLLVDVQTRQEVWLYGLAARNTGLATALGATPARGVVLVFVSDFVFVSAAGNVAAKCTREGHMRATARAWPSATPFTHLGVGVGVG